MSFRFPDKSIYGGELLDFERRFLWGSVIKFTPRSVLEVGTGTAGGSTFYIADALYQLDKRYQTKYGRKLYTCDPNITDATEIYQDNKIGAKYKDIVKFYNVGGLELINILKDMEMIPEFIFFDGPESPQLMLDCFMAIENCVEKECMFCMHDWETSININKQQSIKAKLLRPYLHNSNNWEIIKELSGKAGIYPNNNQHNSVGMVLARKIK